MLIDVTCKPVAVLPDECPSAVIVRTMHPTRVGLPKVSFAEETLGRRHLSVLEPAAQLVQGDSTLFETRLLLPGMERPNRYVRDDEQTPVLPDPYDITSLYTDPVTLYKGVHCIGVGIQEKTPFFLVTVLDLQTHSQLIQIKTKGLQPSRVRAELTPIQRWIQKKASTSTAPIPLAWERLLADD